VVWIRVRAGAPGAVGATTCIDLGWSPEAASATHAQRERPGAGRLLGRLVVLRDTRTPGSRTGSVAPC